jgi:hypothetical protein
MQARPTNKAHTVIIHANHGYIYIYIYICVTIQKPCFSPEERGHHIGGIIYIYVCICIFLLILFINVCINELFLVTVAIASKDVMYAMRHAISPPSSITYSPEAREEERETETEREGGERERERDTGERERETQKDREGREGGGEREEERIAAARHVHAP